MNAFGYHNHGLGYQTSYKSHALYHNDIDEFKRVFLENRRAEEVDVLSHLAPHVRAGSGKVWVLSVVAKEDLWDGQAGAVDEFYSGNGAYALAAASLIPGGGTRQVKHEVAKASLALNNFVTGKGEMMWKTTAGYDQNRQLDSLLGLFRKLNALREWDAGN